MICVQTAYPCVNCQNKIDPQNKFCQYCGAKQPSLSGRVLYNVFYRRIDRNAFNMMIDGIVLEIDDVKEFLQRGFISKGFLYFIGSYTRPKLITDPSKFPVQNWIPFVDGQFGEDQGPQEIQITYLE